MNPGADPAALPTQPSVHPADDRLMEAWIDGDADAFEWRYARHRGPPHRLCCPAGNTCLADAS